MRNTSKIINHNDTIQNLESIKSTLKYVGYFVNRKSLIDTEQTGFFIVMKDLGLMIN